jgi:hypothetical protein
MHEVLVAQQFATVIDPDNLYDFLTVLERVKNEDDLYCTA